MTAAEVEEIERRWAEEARTSKYLPKGTADVLILASGVEAAWRALASLPRASVVVDDPEGFRCLVCGQRASSPMLADHPDDCAWKQARLYATPKADAT